MRPNPPLPYFTIAMPVYNREELVGRALRSCLSQSLTDFEIVVVDDCSTDATCDVVRGFDDARIRLFKQSQNRGVSPTRNIAIANARGRWILFLDSDDELLPDGLSLISARIRDLDAGVGVARFMCQFDSGDVSPDPPFSGEVRDYVGYLKWLEAAQRSRHEAIICVRRDVFEVASFPDGRATEALFHLDYAKTYRTADFPDLVRLYHQDAHNSLCATFSISRARRSAPDEARMLSKLLVLHGIELRLHAPDLLESFLRAATVYSAIAGDRVSMLRFGSEFLRRQPLSLRMVATMGLGLLGPLGLLLPKWGMSRLRSAPSRGVTS